MHPIPASKVKPTRAPKVKPPIGDIRDPDSLYRHMQRYLAWLAERQYSEQTVRHSEVWLRWFIEWCDERGLGRPHDITKPILERYQRYLFLYRKEDGQPLAVGTQYGGLARVRSYFRWLARQNYILFNPASDLDLPRLGQRLPKYILSVMEVETVMAQPDLDDPLGIRDRAILETFYSTGIRRMEMVGLGVFDVDAARGTLMVRQGKGQKDRVIPIGERALQWVAKYRDDVRPGMVGGADPGHLFLTQYGEGFTASGMSELVSYYIRAAKLGKPGGSCHLFRHTMATLMLEGGADVRYIQAMLGHASLDTTQIYTQVSIRQLKAIHTATHPGRVIAGGQAGAIVGDPADADALLALLDVEAQEENGDA